MTDINFSSAKPTPATGDDDAQLPAPVAHYDLIELLFFAYRDFISEPDEILSGYAFGRAHHRVLHFVDRNPGLSVADLLDILKITKQSLARVLKQLVDQGYIEQRAGRRDRRQRLLHPTAQGSRLARKLAGIQSQRISRALEHMDAAGRAAATDFLTRLINDTERKQLLAIIREADKSG